ncbi:MAG TPA: hypothetical protein VIA18_25115, partial [Polyangia bacterium]|nr:hypothetical protein [Polyangia bacterium]
HRDLVARLLADLEAAPPETLAPLWPRIVPSLRKLQKADDVLLRARTARLAVHAADGELIAAALADAALPVRLAGLAALAAFTPPLPVSARAPLVAVVERALQSGDWRERRAAVLAAAAHGELWPDKGARALAALKRDNNGFVREALPSAIR